MIIATLTPETKEEIDVFDLAEDCQSAYYANIDKAVGMVFLTLEMDLNGDLEKYRDLDELIKICPTELNDEERARFEKLCEICPDMKVVDELTQTMTHSSTQEYKRAEAWIDEVLGGINEGWSDVQKLAYIDNAIGKKLSYSPDFDTEVFDHGKSRALWKVINSGYGVCNGIAQVEWYMLKRIGIDSEMISTMSHKFLKINGIELPDANGNPVKGKTILDPCWNLAAHRFGGFPDNFCRSYAEIRKHDIDQDGIDRKCHENDEELQDATLDLDESHLREVFKSVGLTLENGAFPATRFFEVSSKINKQDVSAKEKLRQQLELLAQYYSEFATCQNSTMSIMGNIIDSEALGLSQCVVGRVYDIKDEDKKSLMYVYAEMPNGEKKFYFANKDEQRFEEMNEEEFEAKFECYEYDLEKHDGVRPWKEEEQKEEKEDLSRSSGKIVADSGEVER